ncbi:Vms1/Ankzf1 family peptidyl-tRNA hydrolase [Modestobacter sp. VKM Ac-2979]|uniref:baeRF2 domain-containing protein n=1 Tax=unclassified Modestobacter TaxID=2643866 RepID=UPI0022AB5D5D|nr:MULTISPECIES: Vms1/Ankzf1 family peptidyl-tRNA hydrolase [unclassified Modestobacter]MCZ2813085.1 Vms1/Ankzf1 family peptidyl-tRNA hydrolase [Modestobacter sp. VKM Ac-2979]MCZ2842886.1 Vms1/Ankzf1 family peptidyl-tRNA hydrolase [Modestobacter sp. VKM Ac-2980]
MDVTFLEQVFSAPGPYATVCADVTHTTENADAEVELRVRAVCEELAADGAPEGVVESVRSQLLQANDGGEIATLRGRALIVAADGSVVLDEALADVPRDPVAHWSPHPDLLPVLRQLAGRVPHVVVVADRVGADVSVATVPGRPTDEDTIEGDTFHIRKVKVGGWAHNTYMHTAENQWEENAGQVADHLHQLVTRTGARFVLVAGDVRARQLLADKASKEVGDVLVSMEEGGRAAGADRAPVQLRALELVAEHEAHGQAQAVEQVQAASAHGLAVTGTAQVVEALRKAQVETLVIADQVDDEQLLVGTDPLQIGVDDADMTALGVSGAERIPADQALLRAAVASDAAVVVVPRTAMPEGVPVAAVLRYTDASTPS